MKRFLLIIALAIWFCGCAAQNATRQDFANMIRQNCSCYACQECARYQDFARPRILNVGAQTGLPTWGNGDQFTYGHANTMDDFLEDHETRLDAIEAYFTAGVLDIVAGGTAGTSGTDALTNLGGVEESSMVMGGCSGQSICTAEEIMADQTVDAGACAYDFTGCQIAMPDDGIAFLDSDDPDATESGQIRLDHNGAGEPGQKILRLYDQDLTAQVALASSLYCIDTATVIKPNDMADATRDKLKIWDNLTGMTFVITKIVGGSDTDNTTLNVEEYDADGESNNATVDAVEIATGTSWFTQTETTITGANIEAGHGIWIDFDDTDDPGQVALSICGHFLSDVN